MEEEPLVSDRRALGGVPAGGRRGGRVEGVARERRDGAELEGREVEDARREDLRRLGPRRRRRAHGQRRDHLEVLEAAPPLVQLEGRLLGPARPVARRLAVACVGCRGRRRGVLGGLLGAGEHLDDLLEGVGVGLHEGRGERGGLDRAGYGPRRRAEVVVRLGLGLGCSAVVGVGRRGGGGGGRGGGRRRGVGVPLLRHGEELLGGR